MIRSDIENNTEGVRKENRGFKKCRLRWWHILVTENLSWIALIVSRLSESLPCYFLWEGKLILSCCHLHTFWQLSKDAALLLTQQLDFLSKYLLTSGSKDIFDEYKHAQFLCSLRLKIQSVFGTLGLSYLIVSSCQMICWILLLSPLQWIDGIVPALGRTWNEGNFSKHYPDVPSKLCTTTYNFKTIYYEIHGEKETLWIHVSFMLE